MEYRQRRLIAAVVLVLSLFIVAYLVFFTPSEENIPTPTATAALENSALSWTPLPVATETDIKRTAEAADAARDMTPSTGVDSSASPAGMREPAPMPEWMGRIESSPVNTICPGAASRHVPVANAQELTQALETAQAGDQIVLAPGKYAGNFSISASGEQGKQIWICGPREAVIDSGGPANGTALLITGSMVGVWGISVTNAQTGILVDGGTQVQIDYVAVSTTGGAGIAFQSNASDGVVQDSLIHHTGLTAGSSGVGVSVGAPAGASSDELDQNDNMRISRTRIWDTAAESIRVREGSTGGLLDYNSFDGTAMTTGDSWVDLRGNEYVVRGNVGVGSPGDGFQTHNVGNLGWGKQNTFTMNTVQLDGPG
ncbi:MAG: hypothetical protein KC438_03630, partial [Thermomicrobiales bacterium]|nr:hypothetical protein [Thermomicrobiales bacterium]